VVQVPAPSHTRQVPQPFSGSVLTGWLTQVPSWPATLQARQAPEQEPVQQTPSTQEPLVHSLAAPQVCPLGFLVTHRPPLQKLPAVQCVSSAQSDRQAVLVALHW
jgi:hypothetical protein